MPEQALKQGITRTIAQGGVLVALLLSAGCERDTTPFLAEYPVIDLLVENGRLLDGLGSEAVLGDVVIVGDRIVFVGDAAFDEDDIQARVRRRIDAASRTLTPGFIDLHSHGDPFETPTFENFLAMGVTTITLGQDGSSPEVADLPDWLDRAAASGTGVNVAMLVGHGTLRTLSGIGLDQDPPPEQLARMLELLDRSLPYTFGMSTGL
jgi:N-acyl-D-aspartate/D-glutamate deacylase